MDENKKEILELLKVIFATYPQLRVGQVMNNLLEDGESLFFMVDKVMIKRLKGYIKGE